jgi:DNA-binding transcriptional regulator PaaX
MPEREGGYKTIDLIMQEFGATEEEVRALISLLNIQPKIFREDKRRRFYSPEDIQRMRQALKAGRG